MQTVRLILVLSPRAAGTRGIDKCVYMRMHAWAHECTRACARFDLVGKIRRKALVDDRLAKEPAKQCALAVAQPMCDFAAD